MFRYKIKTKGLSLWRSMQTPGNHRSSGVFTGYKMRTLVRNKLNLVQGTRELVLPDTNVGKHNYLEEFAGEIKN